MFSLNGDTDLGKITIEVHKCREIRKDDWLIDSSATDHFVKDPESFVPGTMVLFSRGIRTATDQVTYLTHKGDVEVNLDHPDGPRKVLITDVLYVPEIAINLLGTIRLGKKRIGVNLLPDEVVFTNLVNITVIGYGDVIYN